MRKILKVISFIALAFLIKGVVFADQGFDYVAYLSANPDLPSEWGKDECMTHYKLFGFWENRAVTFNLEEYLDANPDLPTDWTHEEALNHYNVYGKNENRLLAFESREYLSLYGDLPQYWTYEQAYVHYITYGRGEGRIASFDETAYLELYDDLPRSWGQEQAFFHYICYGQYENRVYDPYDEDVFQPDSSSGDVEEGVLFLDVNNPEKTFKGNTLFTDGYNNRVLEVNMLGEIVWEFDVPAEWIVDGHVGFEAEMLSDGTILLVISQSGLYRIDRNGNIIFHHDDPDISHDADLLDNGNYLYVFGNRDLPGDAAIKECTPQGEIVWSWYPSEHYLETYPPDLWSDGGYAHVNGAQRLSDGTTLVSLRNFHTTAILDENGNVIKEYGWYDFGDATHPHDPVIDEQAGTLLVSLQKESPYAAVEIDLDTREALWTYPADGLRVTRDANRLPNGNYLLTTVDAGGTAYGVDTQDDRSTIIEVTPGGEIVWKLTLDLPVGPTPGWFFKAQRY